MIYQNQLFPLIRQIILNFSSLDFVFFSEAANCFTSPEMSTLTAQSWPGDQQIKTEATYEYPTCGSVGAFPTTIYNPTSTHDFHPQMFSALPNTNNITSSPVSDWRLLQPTIFNLSDPKSANFACFGQNTNSSKQSINQQKQFSQQEQFGQGLQQQKSLPSVHTFQQQITPLFHETSVTTKCISYIQPNQQTFQNQPSVNHFTTFSPYTNFGHPTHHHHQQQQLPGFQLKSQQNLHFGSAPQISAYGGHDSNIQPTQFWNSQPNTKVDNQVSSASEPYQFIAQKSSINGNRSFQFAGSYPHLINGSEVNSKQSEVNFGNLATSGAPATSFDSRKLTNFMDENVFTSPKPIFEGNSPLAVQNDQESSSLSEEVLLSGGQIDNASSAIDLDLDMIQPTVFGSEEIVDVNDQLWRPY